MNFQLFCSFALHQTREGHAVRGRKNVEKRSDRRMVFVEGVLKMQQTIDWIPLRKKLFSIEIRRNFASNGIWRNYKIFSATA